MPGSSKQTLPRAFAPALLALLLAACSSDTSFNILPKFDSFVPESLELGTAGNKFAELRPVTAADLVDQQGRCAAAPTGQGPDASDSSGLVRGGISLQMTECDVVRRAGPPDQIELGATERGGRALTLTYSSGPRPGVYRFADGRVTSIERGPEPPPAAPQPKKKPAPKKPPPPA